MIASFGYPLPKSWTNAIGILKDTKIDAVEYQRGIRREWDRRMQKQVKGYLFGMLVDTNIISLPFDERFASSGVSGLCLYW